MKRFFQVIKKKKHKRRFAALCLFLISLELFCPVLSDEKISLAAALQVDSPTTSSVVKFDDDESTEKSVTTSDSQAPENHQTNCNDECFCHATALPNAAIPPLKEPFVRQETVAFNFGEPLTNSLPPPYHPPKLS